MAVKLQICTSLGNFHSILHVNNLIPLHFPHSIGGISMCPKDRNH